MSKSVFSQSQKKTLLVSSCDWVVVEASVVPFSWPSPPCSVAVPWPFGLGAAQRVNVLERRPRNVRVCWHLSLVAVEHRCQGEGFSH